MALRKIVKIDEEKCDGCGQCVPACVEGALRVIDGKARFVSDVYCDGLGACLGDCPQGAITIEEREAESFDEEVAKKHAQQDKEAATPLPCGCPSAVAKAIERAPRSPEEAQSRAPAQANLGNWPIQFRLLPAKAPFLEGADLLIAADCIGFAYPVLHQDLLPGKVTVIGCPKLGDADALTEKLAEVFSNNDIQSVTIAHMEVPCCHGLLHVVRQALTRAGKEIPVSTVEIGIQGERKSGEE